MKVLLAKIFDVILGKPVNVEHGFTYAYSGQIIQHADVTGGPEITCMQDAIAIDEQKLRPKLCCFQPVKKYSVHWYLLKCQKARHVRVVSRLLLIILVNYFHVGVTKD